MAWGDFFLVNMQTKQPGQQQQQTSTNNSPSLLATSQAATTTTTGPFYVMDVSKDGLRLTARHTTHHATPPLDQSTCCSHYLFATGNRRTKCLSDSLVDRQTTLGATIGEGEIHDVRLDEIHNQYIASLLRFISMDVGSFLLRDVPSCFLGMVLRRCWNVLSETVSQFRDNQNLIEILLAQISAGPRMIYTIDRKDFFHG